MNMISNNLSWMTADSIWNAPSEAAKMKEKWKGKETSFLQKVSMGAQRGMKNFPRKAIIGTITAIAFAMIFSSDNMLNCVKNLPKSNSDLKSDLLFTSISVGASPSPLKIAIKAILEEIIFRAGIQNGLGKLESSDYKILSHLGSLKGRVIVTSILFAGIHSRSFFTPCMSWQVPAGQIVQCLLDCNYSILYESGGITSSASSHVVNNLLPGLTLIFTSTITRSIKWFT